MATPEQIQLLTSALRTAASRAAELVGGGAAMIFATLPGEDAEVARLRAASGFASLDDARAAASELSASVQECSRSNAQAMMPSPAAMGSRAAAGVICMPLAVDGAVHGVLAVGTPIALPAETGEALSLVASSAAIHLDHLCLRVEIDSLNNATSELLNNADEKGDELLKLSETLFAQDIELLRSNEKLGQVEKIKSDFIEKMSRELRSPLNSIIEATISVLAGENENLSDNGKQSLRRALDEGTTYQRTLQNILDLWRIKQGELPIEIQDLNFGEVVDEAIFSVQDTLTGKPVTIEKQIAEPFPKIKTDLAKLNQILFLLLDNAAKFTVQGRIEIIAGLADGRLHCEIRDTGIGICPDDQGYIYDEFFQVDERAGSEYRGAGVGLSLVRDLLIMLGGECDIRSEAGQGTSASIELPVQVA
jgi:two-component system sensor histidine kinase ChiS